METRYVNVDNFPLGLENLCQTGFSVFVQIGPNSSVFSPHKLAKNLTPTLLKTRKRFETMSAGSTTDTEGGISPLWECEEVSDSDSE